MLGKNATITDWKKHLKLNFKLVIMTGSRPRRAVMSDVKQTNGKRVGRGKNIAYATASSFANVSPGNYQKILKSDCAGLFGIVPSPILAEYLTGNL